MALSERLATARQALSRLQEFADLASPTVADRDAAILRFIFSFEIAWKTARAALLETHGPERLQSASPKAVIRESRVAGWLDEGQTEAMLDMANDRNLAVHAYDEQAALALYGRLSGHARLIGQWLERIDRDAAHQG